MIFDYYEELELGSTLSNPHNALEFSEGHWDLFSLPVPVETTQFPERLLELVFDVLVREDRCRLLLAERDPLLE